jgi:hypothetical protein
MRFNFGFLAYTKKGTFVGCPFLGVCSAVSYFSTRVGSIIGAGRLSFRVRDGSGRFPVAISAVTLFNLFIEVCFGGGVQLSGCWIVVAVVCV